MAAISRHGGWRAVPGVVQIVVAAATLASGVDDLVTAFELRDAGALA